MQSKRPEATEAAYQKALKRAEDSVGRSVVLTLQLSPAERATLDVAAARIGETLSSFVRSCALDVAQAISERDIT